MGSLHLMKHGRSVTSVAHFHLTASKIAVIGNDTLNVMASITKVVDNFVSFVRVKSVGN